jgi:hypothetical protein
MEFETVMTGVAGLRVDDPALEQRRTAGWDEVKNAVG